MRNKILSVMIMPDLDSVSESMGYDENDEGNLDDMLFQQGFDGDVNEFEDEEIFKINKGFVGRVVESVYDDEVIDDEVDQYYLIFKKNDLKQKTRFPLSDDLGPGRYQFYAEEDTILKIS